MLLKAGYWVALFRFESTTSALSRLARVSALWSFAKPMMGSGSMVLWTRTTSLVMRKRFLVPMSNGARAIWRSFSRILTAPLALPGLCWAKPLGPPISSSLCPSSGEKECSHHSNMFWDGGFGPNETWKVLLSCVTKRKRNTDSSMAHPVWAGFHLGEVSRTLKLGSLLLVPNISVILFVRPFSANTCRGRWLYSIVASCGAYPNVHPPASDT